MAGRPKQVNASDVDAQEQLAEEAHAELPEPGHERREVLKRRQETMEMQIARLSEKMLRGTIDAKELEIVNEIASKTQYLAVSGAQPDYVYGWISKNRHGQHIQSAKMQGWETVQGDDPEGLELKGTDGSTTRQLGDVILMRIKKDIYIVMEAQKQAQTKRVQQNSASTLVEMGEKYRKHGFAVRPYKMESFEGPEIRSNRLSSHGTAMQQIDAALRNGTVPGMEINQ
jgi:hypothetical protein